MSKIYINNGYLTEKGRERARRMLSELAVKEQGLYERFTFCEIEPGLSDEAVKIEQICFPPLTCHKEKIKMYRKFGFDDLGESASEWGGEKWHEMEIRLNF